VSVVQDQQSTEVYLWYRDIFTEPSIMNGFIRLAHQMTDKESCWLFCTLFIINPSVGVDGYFQSVVHLPELWLLDWYPMIIYYFIYGGTH